MKGTRELLGDYPKEVILKDGTGVTLRPLGPGDEKALNEMFKGFSEDELWFLNQDVSDPRVIKTWVRDQDPARAISIIALLEGRVIGNGVLTRKAFGAESHIGKIRVSVAPDYRERRLGTWMLLDLVNLAMGLRLRTVVVPLVREKDALLMAGVKKLQFAEQAILKNYLLDREGRPYDLVIMMKKLPAGWQEP